MTGTFSSVRPLSSAVSQGRCRSVGFVDMASVGKLLNGRRCPRLRKILAKALQRAACVTNFLPELTRPGHGSASTRPQR